MRLSRLSQRLQISEANLNPIFIPVETGVSGRRIPACENSSVSSSGVRYFRKIRQAAVRSSFSILPSEISSSTWAVLNVR